MTFRRVHTENYMRISLTVIKNVWHINSVFQRTSGAES